MSYNLSQLDKIVSYFNFVEKITLHSKSLPSGDMWTSNFQIHIMDLIDILSISCEIGLGWIP